MSAPKAVKALIGVFDVVKLKLPCQLRQSLRVNIYLTLDF